MSKFLKYGVILFFFSANAALALAFRHEPLAIKTASGEQRFTVDIAETPPQQEHGLMFRKTLPPDYGMLFIMQQDYDITMWMKNTPLSLDMLFINRHGRIVYIAADTTPESTAVIHSGQPVRAVLELKGGEAKRRGIRVGDEVISHYFTP